MKIFTEFPLEKIDYKTIFTAGVFDGIHLGHKKLLDVFNNTAESEKLNRALLTFTDSPKIISADNKNQVQEFKILQDEIKLKELEKWTDMLFLIDFKNIAHFSPEFFLEEILIKKLNVSRIIAGYDFRFGKEKKGGYELLEEKLPGKITLVSPLEIDGEIVSSSLIRKYLSENNIDRANKFLGKEFSITGKVQRGKRLATSLGFPTVNLIYPNNIIDLSGIFKSSVLFDGKRYASISHFGVVPTFNSNERIIETYIFDFNKEIYGQEITVFPAEFLRPIIKFNSIDELKKQIIIDINNIVK